MAYGPRSARTTPLPLNWKTEIRPRILTRDGHACQWKVSLDGTRCGAPATDVDHIGAPDDHSDENLQALCGSHHKRKSGGQGARARNGRRRPRQRPTGQHPGLL